MNIVELKSDLAALKAARLKILEGGQSYTIGKRAFTRADLSEINREIRSLEQRVAMAEGGNGYSHTQAVFGGRR